MYFVFQESSYDGLEFFGELRLDQLRALLTGGRDDNDIGYDKYAIEDLLVIQGVGLSPESLVKIKSDNQ